MSKTIVGVLEVAAIVGLQFTGVGGIVADTLSTIGVGVTAAQGATIATIALAATEYGINALIAPSIKPEQTETAIKGPLPVRVTGYGIARLAGSMEKHT